MEKSQSIFSEDYSNLSVADNFSKPLVIDNYSKPSAIDNHPNFSVTDNYSKPSAIDNYSKLSATDNYSKSLLTNRNVSRNRVPEVKKPLLARVKIFLQRMEFEIVKAAVEKTNEERKREFEKEKKVYDKDVALYNPASLWYRVLWSTCHFFGSSYGLDDVARPQSPMLEKEPILIDMCNNKSEEDIKNDFLHIVNFGEYIYNEKHYKINIPELISCGMNKDLFWKYFVYKTDIHTLKELELNIDTLTQLNSGIPELEVAIASALNNLGWTKECVLLYFGLKVEPRVKSVDCLQY